MHKLCIQFRLNTTEKREGFYFWWKGIRLCQGRVGEQVSSQTFCDPKLSLSFCFSVSLPYIFNRANGNLESPFLYQHECISFEFESLYIQHSYVNFMSGYCGSNNLYQSIYRKNVNFSSENLMSINRCVAVRMKMGLLNVICANVNATWKLDSKNESPCAWNWNNINC